MGISHTTAPTGYSEKCIAKGFSAVNQQVVWHWDFYLFVVFIFGFKTENEMIPFNAASQAGCTESKVSFQPNLSLSCKVEENCQPLLLLPSTRDVDVRKRQSKGRGEKGKKKSKFYINNKLYIMTTSEDNKIKSTGFSIRKQINKTLEQLNLRLFFSLLDTENFCLNSVPRNTILWKHMINLKGQH